MCRRIPCPRAVFRDRAYPAAPSASISSRNGLGALCLLGERESNVYSAAVKKRAFETEDAEDARQTPAPPPRTEPAPHQAAAIGLILLSWVLPLGMVVSLFRYAETEPTTLVVHRALALTSFALLLAGLGLAIRAIDRARRDPRMRRRLAIAALLLGIATPFVWMSELVLAFRVFVVREQLDAAATEGDASSPPAE
jgi:hypothetical protein